MNKSGSVLIATLWALIILAIFAVSLARGASYNIKFADYVKNKVVSHYLARAGIKMAVQKLITDENMEYDSFNESWAGSEDDFKEVNFGMGGYTVGYEIEENGQVIAKNGAVDEERKININKASGTVLSNLIQISSGAASSLADSIGASITDWRDQDSVVSEGGAEDSYYEGLSPSYICKDKDMETIEELLLIKGMTPEILQDIREYITLYGDGAVNINTADRVVLQALGMESSLAIKIVDFRTGSDKIEGTEDDNIFTGAAVIVSFLESRLSLTDKEKTSLNTVISQGLLSVRADNFRIRSTGYTAFDNSTRTIEAVVDRTLLSGITVVYWRED